MMCQLAAAHDAFKDIQNNLKEGTKFYNDLIQVGVLVSILATLQLCSFSCW